MTIIGGLVYLYHLIFTIAGVNNFADITRLDVCGSVSVTNPVKAGQDAASDIMDLAIALTTIFHMIEWLRWLAFCTAATVGVNLIPVFYGISLFTMPFGIIAMLVAIGTRFGGDSSDCAADK
mgnify:CR=1 FL=1